MLQARPFFEICGHSPNFICYKLRRKVSISSFFLNISGIEKSTAAIGAKIASGSEVIS